MERFTMAVMGELVILATQPLTQVAQGAAVASVVISSRGAQANTSHSDMLLRVLFFVCPRFFAYAAADSVLISGNRPAAPHASSWRRRARLRPWVRVS
mgnify:CR=1 FL=1